MIAIESYAYDLAQGVPSEVSTHHSLTDAVEWATCKQDRRCSVVHDVVVPRVATPGFEDEWIGLTTYELRLLIDGTLHIPPRTRHAS